MHLDFLTPDVWNGLVIGTVLIAGVAALVCCATGRPTRTREGARARRNGIATTPPTRMVLNSARAD